MDEVRDRIARLYRTIGNENKSYFGKIIGVSGTMVSQYLEGKKTPGSDKIIDICLACNVSADWLLFGDELKFKNGTKVEKSIKPDDEMTSIEELRELLDFYRNENRELKQRLSIYEAKKVPGGS